MTIGFAEKYGEASAVFSVPKTAKLSFNIKYLRGVSEPTFHASRCMLVSLLAISNSTELEIVTNFFTEEIEVPFLSNFAE